MQEMISTQAAGCHALQGTVEQLVARIANKRRDRSGNGKVSVSQVCALTTKPSWDPEECGGNIWNESLDPEVESELALEGKEVAEAQTPPHTHEGAAGTSGWGSAGHTYLHPKRVWRIFTDL